MHGSWVLEFWILWLIEVVVFGFPVRRVNLSVNKATGTTCYLSLSC